MSSVVSDRKFAWLLLGKKYWWPSHINLGQNEIFSIQSDTGNYVAHLIGTNENISVNVNDTNTVELDDTFAKRFCEFEEQILPHPLSDCFDEARKAVLRFQSEIDSPTQINKIILKRKDYISWDDYFMSVALIAAMRSKDPSTQVGACIVDQRRRIVGIGYNGFPRGCSDDELPWARVADNELDTKYPYVCHAEVNAILNKNIVELFNCSLYVGLFPCNECAKLIIQSGIQEIVYLSDKYHNTNAMKASRRMLRMAAVRCRQHVPQQTNISIDFTKIVGVASSSSTQSVQETSGEVS